MKNNQQDKPLPPKVETEAAQGSAMELELLRAVVDALDLHPLWRGSRYGAQTLVADAANKAAKALQSPAVVGHAPATAVEELRNWITHLDERLTALENVNRATSQERKPDSGAEGGQNETR